MNTLQKIADWVKGESAVIMYALNAAVTAWVAFGFRASPDQVAAVALIGTAVITAVTAFATRPVSVPVITGAVAAIATSSAAFGLHLTAAQIGAAAPLFSIILSLVLRQAITPVANIPQKADAHP